MSVLSGGTSGGRPHFLTRQYSNIDGALELDTFQPLTVMYFTIFDDSYQYINLWITKIRGDRHEKTV